ncbi:streptophobe family protein [Streptomyces sp. NPDC048172]|uniref:streptophobe family protein n=1 Tax=Streptomyces sp. NPDC048172 TaxID=3365505 RepID=UPI00371BD9F5
MPTVARTSRTVAPAPRSLPVTEILLTSLAAVGWSLLGMAGVAALGLHLLDVDATGSLGALTAAAVALAVGGSVVPDGDVRVFGLKGAEANAALDVMPLGVTLAGALLLALVFLRGLRAARVRGPLRRGELVARTGTALALFTVSLGALAWAGRSTVTIDGSALGAEALKGKVKDELGGGALGDIGGGFLDRVGDLAKAKADVGFRVELVPTVLTGACWAAGVLLIALVSSRFTPLPPGRFWDAVHRTVRPAASAFTQVALVTVVAGLAAAAYAAVGDAHPKRVVGAALVGAPNGTWTGMPLGLFVAWSGHSSGAMSRMLPDPLDDVMRRADGGGVTVRDLAELDGRVWLMAVATVLAMLTAGVLTAARTPRRGARALPFAVRCGLRLGIVTGLAWPLLVWLTGLSANAGLSVLGVDAYGAGIEMRGSVPEALLLGCAWGALAGFTGALLACATGAAGRHASAYALGPGIAAGREGSTYDASRTYPSIAYERGPYRPPAGPPGTDEGWANPYKHGAGGRGEGGRGAGGAGPYSQPTVDGETLGPRVRPEPPPPGPPPPGSDRGRRGGGPAGGGPGGRGPEGGGRGPEGGGRR